MTTEWFERVIKEAVESDPLGALRILLSNGYRLRRRKVMAITWQLVESSNVAAIGYEREDIDHHTDLLHVQFKNGSEYIYHNVPVNVVQEFLDADSKGKYLNQNIILVYDYERVR